MKYAILTATLYTLILSLSVNYMFASGKLERLASGTKVAQIEKSIPPVKLTHTAYQDSTTEMEPLIGKMK